MMPSIYDLMVMTHYVPRALLRDAMLASRQPNAEEGKSEELVDPLPAKLKQAVVSGTMLTRPMAHSLAPGKFEWNFRHVILNRF